MSTGIGKEPTGKDWPSERSAIRLEYERARATFHGLVTTAFKPDLGRPSRGTRWTNRQLLFHMLFGYVVVRALLPLVKFVSSLPAGIGRRYGALLDAAARPFNAINYWGSVVGAFVYRGDRMAAKFDTVIAALECRLSREDSDALTQSMAFPTRWDPFFRDVMTVADIYRYPTQHFEFHRQQLTLDGDDDRRQVAAGALREEIQP
ncbi:MAG TPA: hypothetical protein VNG12_09970 [Acidimicrobiales bacterium]|nr:hypothetical protein [Acidimicrobiales bacterium]